MWFNIFKYSRVFSAGMLGIIWDSNDCARSAPQTYDKSIGRYAVNGYFHNDPLMWWLIKITCIVDAFWRHPFNGNTADDDALTKNRIYLYFRTSRMRSLSNFRSKLRPLWCGRGFSLRMFSMLSDDSKNARGLRWLARGLRFPKRILPKSCFAEHQRLLTGIKVCRSDRVEMIKLIHFVPTSVAGRERSIIVFDTRNVLIPKISPRLSHTFVSNTNLRHQDNSWGHDADTETFFLKHF